MNKILEMLPYFILALLLVGVCAGWGSCKAWQYDECVATGHSAAYCSARTAGCVR